MLLSEIDRAAQIKVKAKNDENKKRFSNAPVQYEKEKTYMPINFPSWGDFTIELSSSLLQAQQQIQKRKKKSMVDYKTEKHNITFSIE